MPKPLEALALPGKFLLGKITEFKKQQQEQSRRKVTERELAHLHHKIDKLLVRLEEHELEPAQSQDEECAICISAKATMQTFPCGHRVVCRKCFVKTIQMAVSQRLLPLRCVICRAKILRLKQLSGGHQPVTEAMPRSFISCGPSKMGFVGYANSKLSQPLGDLVESKRPLPMPPSRVQPFRSRRSGGTTRPLVPIPETEELEIVHSVRDVQQDDFCSDLGHEVWTMDEDLKLIPKEKKPMQKNGRWWSRFYRCRLAAPALIRSIRKKCK